MRTSLLLTGLFLGTLATAPAVIVTFDPTGDAYVRSAGSQNTNFDDSELLVGRVSGSSNDWIRSILAFDLSSIPDGSTINSVTLTVTINALDAPTAGASSDSLGTPGLQLRNLAADPEFDSSDGSADFSWNQSSWGPDDAPLGGDDLLWNAIDIQASDVLTTVLSTVPNGTIPIRSVSAGDVYTFATSPDFVAEVSASLGDDFLAMQMLTPGIETTFDERKLLRFASSSNTDQPAPLLTVDYTIPEPAAALLCGLGFLSVLRNRRRA